jgi:rhodanese-related sulfurtransferase
MAPESFEISPSEVKVKLERGEPLRLVDVREPAEYAVCRLDGAELIPMQTIPQRLNDLDTEGPELIVFCHHGVRSLSVVAWLRRQGVENCRSMSGGIDEWSRTIDPLVPRY